MTFSSLETSSPVRITLLRALDTLPSFVSESEHSQIKMFIIYSVAKICLKRIKTHFNLIISQSRLINFRLIKLQKRLSSFEYNKKLRIGFLSNFMVNTAKTRRLTIISFKLGFSHMIWIK
jgi:hypothetical protein